MVKNKHKSNRAPHIKPTSIFAYTYKESQKDQKAFEAFEKRGERRKQKKLKLGEH